MCVHQNRRSLIRFNKTAFPRCFSHSEINWEHMFIMWQQSRSADANEMRLAFFGKRIIIDLTIFSLAITKRKYFNPPQLHSPNVFDVKKFVTTPSTVPARNSKYNLIYNHSVNSRTTEFFDGRFANGWIDEHSQVFSRSERNEDNVYSIPLLASTHWYLTIRCLPYDSPVPARKQPRPRSFPRTPTFFFCRFLDRRRRELYSI